jgi:hypothetical protein
MKMASNRRRMLACPKVAFKLVDGGIEGTGLLKASVISAALALSGADGREQIFTCSINECHVGVPHDTRTGPSRWSCK